MSLLVQGAERLVERGENGERVRERLARAVRAGERLERLVSDLLDVSRITAGRLVLTTESLDLVSLVREITVGAADHGTRSHSKVRFRTTVDSLVGVWDRSRLEQVFTNLLSNALKYGKGKDVDVDVGRDDSEAVVRVTDQGIGIDVEQQGRIFDRFERAVATRDYGGLGLGLWISRQIVEAGGGRIEVVSAPGQGATFTVRLPVVSGDPT
jgi:signal transduction histidine kinase